MGKRKTGARGLGGGNFNGSSLPFAMPKNVLEATFQAGADISKQVYAQVDQTVQTRRLVSVDRTQLPNGTSIDPATGDMNVVHATPVGNILNAVNQTNNGQALPISAFGVFGNALTIRTQELQNFLIFGINTLILTTDKTKVTIIAEK